MLDNPGINLCYLRGYVPYWGTYSPIYYFFCISLLSTHYNQHYGYSVGITAIRECISRSTTNSDSPTQIAWSMIYVYMCKLKNTAN